MAFAKKELIHLAIVIGVLAFGFSYRFEGPATLHNWFSNFFLVLLLVAVSVFIHEATHKWVAQKLSARTGLQVWPSGIIALIVLLILTNGLVVLAVPWAVSISPKKRFGRPYAHLGPREQGLIALSGPLANLALAIAAKIFASELGLISQKLIWINSSLAIFNLFPFFTVLPVIAAQRAKAKVLAAPYVEGEFVFSGARTLWVFAFSFTLVAGVGLLFLSLAASMGIAVLAAGAIWTIWHYFLEPETLPETKAGSPGWRKH